MSGEALEDFEYVGGGNQSDILELAEFQPTPRIVSASRLLWTVRLAVGISIGHFEVHEVEHATPESIPNKQHELATCTFFEVGKIQFFR